METIFTTRDWFKPHKEAQWRQWHRKADPRKTFSYQLRPLSLVYFSPLNPIFLADDYGPEILNQQAAWTARDGLIPLLQFFRKNPSPKPFQTRFLVHEKFLPFMPAPWRRRVGSYRIENSGQSKQASQVLITGLVSENHCSMNFLEKTLTPLIAKYGEAKLRNMKKLCYLARKEEHAPAQNEKDFIWRYFLKICQTLGARNTEILSWNEFEAQSSFSGTCVLEINENLMCADSYLIHSALHRGAHLLDGVPSKSHFVKLSPHHQIKVQEQSTGRPLSPQDRRLMAKAEKFFSGEPQGEVSLARRTLEKS